jgi:hypothetical protein
MVFLPEQVTEYDKKRAQVAQAPQMELFVSDERSAIDWAADFLKRGLPPIRRSTRSSSSNLGAAGRSTKPARNSRRCWKTTSCATTGTGEVPSQIHSYLSTNHKDLRGLEKNSPR